MRMVQKLDLPQLNVLDGEMKLLKMLVKKMPQIATRIKKNPILAFASDVIVRHVYAMKSRFSHIKPVIGPCSVDLDISIFIQNPYLSGVVFKI